MLQLLSTEISERMMALKTAIGSADANTIRLQAHSLKNLYTILGLSILADSYKYIEANSAAGLHTDLHTQCDERWQPAKKQVLLLLEKE